MLAYSGEWHQLSLTVPPKLRSRDGPSCRPENHRPGPVIAHISCFRSRQIGRNNRHSRRRNDPSIATHPPEYIRTDRHSGATPTSVCTTGHALDVGSTAVGMLEALERTLHAQVFDGESSTIRLALDAEDRSIAGELFFETVRLLGDARYVLHEPLDDRLLGTMERLAAGRLRDVETAGQFR